MYAIIETGGKQYRVQEGDIVFVEKLAVEENAEISMKVVALGKDDGLVVGSPKVTAKIVKNGKSKKITVFTYKAKKGCARKLGHRQPYTKVQIISIA